jgi:uncharacterized protein YfbU (UPF0304 family)
VFGFAKSLGQRPIAFQENHLVLRYGIMNEAHIPYSEIETVVQSGKELEKDTLTKTLSPLGEMESHNVIIRLKSENTLVGLYGFKKNFNTLGLHVDFPNEFVTRLEREIQ